MGRKLEEVSFVFVDLICLISLGIFIWLLIHVFGLASRGS
jgi:hypothetical protein